MKGQLRRSSIMRLIADCWSGSSISVPSSRLPSWPKDGGSALALGAVGTSRACATEKSFFFFSYYYYYWGVPPEACPSSLKVEKTMASFSLRDTDNHFKGNLCISDLPFVTKSVAKMCDVPCIQWLS